MNGIYYELDIKYTCSSFGSVAQSVRHSDIIGSVATMYTTYVLYDIQRDKYYIGQTGNLEDRFKRHFDKRSKYTKSGTWQLVYQESYPTRSEAFQREKYLKSLKNKNALREIMGQ